MQAKSSAALAAKRIGQRARVWANPQLKTFGGFESLTTFGGSASYNAGVRVFDNKGEKTRVDAFAKARSRRRRRLSSS